MLQYLKMEANRAYTENGAESYASTQSDCLDLFSTIGALRSASSAGILRRFVRAFAEDRDLAMKTLFFARDVRGGLGERRVFRTILPWLAENAPASLEKNIPLIAEYGRWDDLLCLLHTPCEDSAIACIRAQLDKDRANMAAGESISLLAKWLPSVNASNRETVLAAKRVAKKLGMRDAEYRRMLSEMRWYLSILENNLRTRDYTFAYEALPSKALFKYRKAFRENDGDRYQAFLDRVKRGEAKMHTGTLTPYELIFPYLGYHWQNGCFLCDLSQEEQETLNVTWDALPDYTTGENALAVIDTSGSMYINSSGLPAAVALSLGLYFAERSKGAFAGHFIEFSARPRLIEIKGETFVDRLRYVTSFNKVANTNIEAVFDLILNAAVKHNVPQSELPAKLYLISDMEFDAVVTGASVTNFEHARQKYAAYGYRLPEVIFWNVESRSLQQPVTMHESGAALVSGCTPRLFSMVAEGALDPYAFMLSVLGSERYAAIAA